MNTTANATVTVDRIIDALGGDDPMLAADAARLLGEVGDSRAIRPLCDYVAMCRYNYKTAAMYALAKLGASDAVPTLRKLVDQPNVNNDWYWTSYKAVRAAAAVSLLALDDDGGIAYLTELADKPDDVFYGWFSPEILRIARQRDIAQPIAERITVESLLGVPDTSTRLSNPAFVIHIVEALGLIGGPAACDALTAYLTWRSRYVRGQAAVSLLASDADQRDRVAEQLEKETTDFARIRMAHALVQAGDDAMIHRLVEAADGDIAPLEVGTAITALGQLARMEFRHVIADALTHGDAYVRMCALDASPAVGVPLRQIQPLLDDPDPRVRLHAAANWLIAQRNDD